jgi:hypothetical protein
MVSATSPKRPEGKIASEAVAPELRWKPLTFPNCRGNLGFTYSPLEHPSYRVRMQFNQRSDPGVGVEQPVVFVERETVGHPGEVVGGDPRGPGFVRASREIAHSRGKNCGSARYSANRSWITLCAFELMRLTR